MNIFVQKLSDPSSEWSFVVNGSDSILSIKEKVKELEPIFDTDKVSLFFGTYGKSVLEDARTISNYGIGNNAHLNCYYRDIYVGGKFTFSYEDGLFDVTELFAGNYVLQSELGGPEGYDTGPEYFRNNSDEETFLWNVQNEGIGWAFRHIPQDSEFAQFVMAAGDVNSPASPILLKQTDFTEGGVSVVNFNIGYYYGFNPIFNKFNRGSEKGLQRFLRLRNSGYI